MTDSDSPPTIAAVGERFGRGLLPFEEDGPVKGEGKADSGLAFAKERSVRKPNLRSANEPKKKTYQASGASARD